jgi:predicted nuclease with TOPRIM domain
MLGFFNKRISELQSMCSDLINQRDKLTDKNSDLQKEITDLKNDIEDIKKITYTSEVSIDFKKINAFSIERIFKGNYITTVVGYISAADGKPKEWYFYCDEINHTRLVKEFNEYKKE